MEEDVSNAPRCCPTREQFFVSTTNRRAACLASPEEDCTDMVGTQTTVGNVEIYVYISFFSLGKEGLGFSFSVPV